MSQAAAFSRLTSSDVWGKILCYADNIHTAEVSKLFNTYTQKAMSSEWAAMSKDERLRARIQSLGEQNLDLNKISSCFAALRAKQKEFDFLLPAERLGWLSGEFSAARFIEAERVIAPKLDRNLMILHEEILAAPPGLTADEFRTWLRDPQNQPALDAVTWLNLANGDLTIIPEEITLFKNLEYLELQNNRLRTIPAYLAKLEKLTYLGIQLNFVEFIAPEVWPILHYYSWGINYLDYIERVNLREVPFIVWFRTHCLIPPLLFSNAVMDPLHRFLRPCCRELDFWLFFQSSLVNALIRVPLIVVQLAIASPFLIIDAVCWSINLLLQYVIAPILDMIRRLLSLPDSVRIQ